MDAVMAMASSTWVYFNRALAMAAARAARQCMTKSEEGRNAPAAFFMVKRVIYCGGASLL
jgi:hypothetical protein